MFLTRPFKNLKPVARKALFFYCLLHVTAVLSYLLNITPSFQMHSLSEKERKDVITYWNDIRQKSENRRRTEEDLRWRGYSKLVSKYLKQEIDLPRDRESYTFKRLVAEAYTAYERKRKTAPDDLSVKDGFEMALMKRYAEDPLYDNGIGMPIYFNPDDPSYRVDRIHKYYLLRDGDQWKNERFWPFSMYTGTSYEFQKYNLTTFYGVFSGYDFSEFGFYVLLPLLVIYLRAIYKRFVA